MPGIEPETSRLEMLLNKQEGTDNFIQFSLSRKLYIQIDYFSHEIAIF